MLRNVDEIFDCWSKGSYILVGNTPILIRRLGRKVPQEVGFQSSALIPSGMLELPCWQTGGIRRQRRGKKKGGLKYCRNDLI